VALPGSSLGRVRLFKPTAYHDQVTGGAGQLPRTRPTVPAHPHAEVLAVVRVSSQVVGEALRHRHGVRSRVRPKTSTGVDRSKAKTPSSVRTTTVCMAIPYTLDYFLPDPISLRPWSFSPTAQDDRGALNLMARTR
jgi:hypothetical protein